MLYTSNMNFYVTQSKSYVMMLMNYLDQMR